MLKRQSKCLQPSARMPSCLNNPQRNFIILSNVFQALKQKKKNSKMKGKRIKKSNKEGAMSCSLSF